MVKIKRGIEEFNPGEGYSWSLSDCPLFPHTFPNEGDAINHFFGQLVNPLQVENLVETDFDRIAGVMSVFRYGSDIFVTVAHESS